MTDINKLPLGVQLYTVREFTQTKSELAETFDKIKQIGYDCVQISAIGAIKAEDVAQVLKDSGLECAATHVGWQRFLGDLDAVIEEHLLWNCKHTAVGMLPREYYLDKDGMKKFLDELEPVSSKLALAGIDFSYHNHHHEFIRCDDGELWLEKLYNTASAEILKAEIDTYWIQAGGANPVDWIKRCSGRQPLLHIKDYRIVIDEVNWVRQQLAEIGEGNLDWIEIFRAAANSGVEYLLVEQDDCNGCNPFDSLEISFKNIRNILKGVNYE